MTTQTLPDLLPGAVWTALRRFVVPYAVATFHVPGDPVPKKRPRIGKGGHAFTPKATKDAEKVVRQAFRDAMPDWVAEPDGTYGVLIEFVTEEGSLVDLDNATKLVWDALNETFWQDDIQVGASFLNLIRGDDPGTTVVLFRMVNNGTKFTRICDCGTRYRSKAKMCKACTQRRAALNELLRPSDDELAAKVAADKRLVFSALVRWGTSGGSPTTGQLAEATGLSEHRVRQILAALTEDGAVTREGRKLRIVGSLKGAAS
jgi:Holliday junction resolvase RusA-like endonuclease